ncbi:MAG: hypothetical protein ORN24_05710 [Burkholderiales bacterium]|nr:hypothetical protein [Burkholderiales bacterium]
MKHIKYSSSAVMYIISIGYVILVLIAIFWHLNVMYILSPYALLTFWCINYTKKRSIIFNTYRISFELGINECGNFFKFCILASKVNGSIEILKLNYYQTKYIINPLKLKAMLANLGYFICYLPDWESQIVISNSTKSNQNIDISFFHYEQAIVEYKTIKNNIINKFKQDAVSLLDPSINQPIFNLKRKKRKFLTSFLYY